jgi:hypothetical protein
LVATGFGFSIPSGATIDGIVVGIERRYSGVGTIRDYRVRIVKGGSIGSTDRATSTNWTTSDVYEDHGGSTDLWGERWTTSDINSSNFGVAISAQKFSGVGSPTVGIDHIRITVYYTASSGSATITANAGSFTLSGQSATLTRGLKATGGTGTFTLSGQSANLLRGLKVTGGTGTFTLSGHAATLLHNHVVGAGVGSFTLSGQAATLVKSYPLSAGTGSFTLTGNDATFTRTYVVGGGTGSFTLGGQAAGLLRGLKVVGGVGSFALTGQASGLIRGFRLDAGAGSFSLTGQVSGLLVNRKISAGSGAFEVNDPDAPGGPEGGGATSLRVDRLPADQTWHAVIEVTTIRHRRHTILDEYCSADNDCENCDSPLPDPVSSDSDDSSDSGESNCSHDFAEGGDLPDPNLPPRWYVQSLLDWCSSIAAPIRPPICESLSAAASPCLADPLLTTDQQVWDCIVAADTVVATYILSRWQQWLQNHYGYAAALGLGIDTGDPNTVPEIKLQWARGHWKNARVVRRRCFVLTAEEVCALCDI